MTKKITLHAWASSNFSPPPSPKTLRAWARNLWIYPYPEKTGREYRVIEDAIFIGNDYNKIALYGPTSQKSHEHRAA